MLVPSMKVLFKAIQRPTETTNMVRLSRIKKTKGLNHINLLKKCAIDKALGH